MVEIIKGPRRSGRTELMLKRHIVHDNSWLLVHTEREAVRLRKIVSEIIVSDELREKKTRTIISYNNVQQLRGHGEAQRIYLDNIEFFFMYILSHPVEAFTMEG